MELEIDRKEIENVLLDWAVQQFGSRFNKVEIESYSYAGKAKFSFEHPKEREDTPLPEPQS